MAAEGPGPSRRQEPSVAPRPASPDVAAGGCDPRPHLRDLRIADLGRVLAEAGIELPDSTVRGLALDVHQRRGLDWDDLEVGRHRRRLLDARLRFGPQLRPAGMREAADGTRKYAFALDSGEVIETVLIVNRENRTLCLSSQAGCALGCTFCATGELGLRRNLTPGEITESFLRVERDAGVRVTDVVFMGMGEPLHNYDAVMDACDNLNDTAGPSISKKRLTISTAGLVPGIRRFTRERRRWRLNLSLHSAVDETRERLMPITRSHPLDAVIDAMREHQQELGHPWVTLQYVAIPDVNMDQRHVDALGERLVGMRYILNVIPWNDTGAGFRAPTWAEVKEFTTRLRALRCPVKTRYSAGKQEGMGCGQLSAETVVAAATGGHMVAPPGIFSG